MSQAQIDEMLSNDKKIIANQKQLMLLEEKELASDQQAAFYAKKDFQTDAAGTAAEVSKFLKVFFSL